MTFPIAEIALGFKALDAVADLGPIDGASNYVSGSAKFGDTVVHFDPLGFVIDVAPPQTGSENSIENYDGPFVIHRAE